MNRKLAAAATALLAGLTVHCAPERAPETEAGLRALARERLAEIDGAIRVEELRRPVEVLRDKWGVPHIFASSAEDLFFAQGFVAAQDRLYQMEIWRRMGSGELAEVFGPDYVERDRFARLVRYRGDMDAEWTSYSPDTYRIAAAFVQGVNAFVRHCGDRLPIEFELLGFRPGEWRPEHCLLRIAGLSMTRNASQELARAEMTAALGLEATQRFLPPDPPRRLDPDPALELSGLDGRVLSAYRAAISAPAPAETAGSNNWVVGRALSATGSPLLASDPHRAVTLPSLRYMVHLVAPGWNVIGAGEPALPGVAIGHNERVGWGFTIVQYDQTDLYVEHTDPANPRRYRYGDQWLDMTVEREQIRVKGRPEPLEVELKFTRHGPVIWEDPANHRVVAMRWAGQEPGTAGYLGSLALDRVRNWDEFVQAMGRWKLPSENMIYADVDGNIGWIPAGLLPVRANWSGLFPVPGFAAKYEWQGFRTVEQLPRRFNPKEGYIATANHNIRPRDYPFDLGFDWAAPYRFRRIDEVLRRGGKFTVRDFERLQHDETSLPARELTALLRQAPDTGSAGFRSAREMLLAWDHVLGKDSAPAALFEIWLGKLTARLVERAAPAEHRALVARHLELPVLIDLLSRAPGPERVAIFESSLEEAWSEAAAVLGPASDGWRWGKLHTITFRHPLSSTPARRAVFDRGPVERGGDGYTPNATRGAGYRQTHGASYRHVLDLGDWDRSVFTSTPGESGQPESPFYDNLLRLWAEGRYAPLLYSRAAIEANTAHRLMLRPRD